MEGRLKRRKVKEQYKKLCEYYAKHGKSPWAEYYQELWAFNNPQKAQDLGITAPTFKPQRY